MKKKRYSKQYWAALAIAILGVFEVNFQLIKLTFGDYSGFSYIAISVAIVILRHYTTQPVEPLFKGKSNADSS